MQLIEEYLGYEIYRRPDGSYVAKDGYGKYVFASYSRAELKVYIRRIA